MISFPCSCPDIHTEGKGNKLLLFDTSLNRVEYKDCIFLSQICDLGSAWTLQRTACQTTAVGAYAWMAPEV